MTYNDAEYRLWDVLIHIVDWDEKHKDTFGTTSESLRDIQAHYLPWSIGKLSKIFSSLAKKGVVRRNTDRRIEIPNFKYLAGKAVHAGEQFYEEENEAEVQSNEHSVRIIEQPVQEAELGVSSIEQEAQNQVVHEEDLTPVNINEFAPSVHPREQAETFKQNQKKPIQQERSEEMQVLESRLIERFGKDIQKPIERFGLTVVRAAANRMRVRMEIKNEFVRNQVGYITTLCKEGIGWEESDEKRLEDKIRVAKEDKEREFNEANKPLTDEERLKARAKLQEIREGLSHIFRVKNSNQDGASSP